MPAPDSLIVAEAVWLSTCSVLAPYAKAGMEAGLYWYGLRNETRAVALMAGTPNQVNRKFNFAVAADDLAELVQSIPEGLVAVAQLHTHPGRDTAHSPWDDEMAVSQRLLSLVLPRYGREPRLTDANVHEFVDGEWRAVIARDAARRIVVVPTLADTRR